MSPAPTPPSAAGPAAPGPEEGFGSSRADEAFEVRSPLDGRVLGRYVRTEPRAVEAAVARARAAQAGWWAAGVRRRGEVMRRVGRLLGRERERLAELIRAETGKPRVEALAEILVSVELVRHYGVVAPGALARRGASTGWLPGKAGYVLREPWGVIGVVTPWNYPLVLVADSVVASLFGGNGVVVKPSEVTPGTALLLAELLVRAGVPEGLVQVVTGEGETGRALVGAGVDKVVFTGSTATGRKVMAAAAEVPVPVALELGGEDPALVLDDADVDRAARGIVYGAFFNAGQTCISTERVFVDRRVADAFLERVVAHTLELRAGTGADVDIGPITTPAQREIVRRQLVEARAAGAEILAGGPPEAEDASVFPPTVVAGVTDEMSLLRDETFGPVLPVVIVDGDEEAVRRANDTGYGLFASVWTSRHARGERVARRLRAGGVSINDTLSHYAMAGLPMGGVGHSGFGRRRGLEGLQEVTRTRSVMVHRFGLARELWWFPYGPAGTALVEALVVLRARGWIGGLPEALRVLRRRKEA